MFLFILESIGTSELLLIGIVALIFLGPRRLPEIAKKIGKITAEFRGTANEFKQTWQREVDFEEEARALDLNAIEAEAKPVARGDDDVSRTQTNAELPSAPAIKEVDPAVFESLRNKHEAQEAEKESVDETEPVAETPSDANDKRNWL